MVLISLYYLPPQWVVAVRCLFGKSSGFRLSSERRALWTSTHKDATGDWCHQTTTNDYVQMKWLCAVGDVHSVKVTELSPWAAVALLSLARCNFFGIWCCRSRMQWADVFKALKNTPYLPSTAERHTHTPLAAGRWTQWSQFPCSVWITSGGDGVLVRSSGGLLIAATRSRSIKAVEQQGIMRVVVFTSSCLDPLSVSGSGAQWSCKRNTAGDYN